MGRNRISLYAIHRGLMDGTPREAILDWFAADERNLAKVLIHILED